MGFMVFEVHYLEKLLVYKFNVCDLNILNYVVYVGTFGVWR
jgi:hypothetical protein